MKKDLVESLECPYCLSHFKIEKIVEGDGDRITFGLIRCRCFSFPIVHGVLLLGLTKGYGGTEENIQPYVPLQVAAIEYLKVDQLERLHCWIRRHVPLLAKIIETPELSYTGFMKSYCRRLAGHIEKDMYDAGRYELLGKVGFLRRRPSLKGRLAATLPGSYFVRLRNKIFPPVFKNWYVKRFIHSEGILWTREVLRTLPLDGPILSLCSGHGIFEFLIGGVDPTTHPRTVCVDGQLLNLFVVRKFVAPSASFICHDVQFPLPFGTGSFDAVFSSGCLGEIPNRVTFLSESIRVASEKGWCLFDTVWEATSEDDRVDPSRYYRYCQNEMRHLTDYYELIQKCAEPKVVQVMVAKDKKVWQQTESGQAQDMLKSAGSGSFLVSSPGSSLLKRRAPLFEGLTALEKERLYLNPSMQSFRRIGSRAFEYAAKDGSGTLTVDVGDIRDESNLSALLDNQQLVLLPERFTPDSADRRVNF